MIFTEGNLQIDFRGAVDGRKFDGADHLKYKYRDSFLYELASGRADKPIHYFVLIALDTLKEEHLLTRKESLERSLPLRGPGGQQWPREIVRACGVFNLESWNRMLPHYPVNRVGAGPRNIGTSR